MLKNTFDPTEENHMAATIKDIVDSAKHEWTHWGNRPETSTPTRKIGHTDDEDAFAIYVLTNYCAVGRAPP